MQKSPTTDKTLGVSINREESFADVRQKAMEDYRQRKTRKNSKGKIDLDNIPVYKPGDLVVISTEEIKNKQYLLVEVFDFEKPLSKYIFTPYDFTFFGIVRKTTSKELKERVGRMIHFRGKETYFARYRPEKFNQDKIKWLEK